MTTDLLRFLLPASGVVALRLESPLTKPMFLEVLKVMNTFGEMVNSAGADEYWNELERRWRGESRWDSVAPHRPAPPPPGAIVSGEYLKAVNNARQSLGNVISRRPYQAFRIGPLVLTFDWFNPADELEIGYVGAGEPVLLLQLAGEDGGPGPSQYQLTSVPQFYEVLEALDAVVQPTDVCGAASLAPPMFGYLDGRVSRTVSPWSFLYPLSVIAREASFPPDAELAEAFTVVRAWPRKRLLLQALPGLSRELVETFVSCARLVGRTAVQETLGSVSGRPGNVIH